MSQLPQPITKSHHHLSFLLHEHSTTLPELLFTALSILFLFSHPSSSSSSSSTAATAICRLSLCQRSRWQGSLSDRSIRHWCMLLLEKMKPSETPEMAMTRAVREELGSVVLVEVGDIGDFVRIVPGSYKMKVEERNSMHYSGLPACYMLHSFEAEVEGPPEDAEFCTEEEEEYEGLEPLYLLWVSRQKSGVILHFSHCIRSPPRGKADQYVSIKQALWFSEAEELVSKNEW